MPYKFNPVTGKLDYYEAGSGSANLATVLANGNASGANDIAFDTTKGVLFNNGSRLREGTIDAALGGQKGVAQICAVGYELKWEAGRLYVMDGNGVYIRWSLYNFTITPTVTDDVSLGYLPGSRWSLDDGSVYLCTDSTIGAAVWTLQSSSTPTLAQVLAAGNSSNNLDIIDIDKLDFNTGTSDTAGEGQMAWNDTVGTVNLGLKGGNTISNLGQHIHARVVNKVTPNQTLTKAGYKAVRVSGAQGQRLAVALAQADSDANSADTIGLVCETIATNQEGYIVCVGQLEGINTTGSLQGETWVDGDVLYLSPFTAGAITNIKPIGAGHIVIIGYVEYSHVNNGKIYVKVMNGWEIDELHDVSINTGTLANNDALLYESATQLWKNKPLPVEIQVACSDETTAITAGTGKVTFRMPHAMTVTSVRASLTTAQTSGSIFTVDINESGTSILSTKLTIDNTEKTSTTAVTASVVSDTALADDAEITIDVDQIGDGTAKGLKVTIIGTRV